MSVNGKKVSWLLFNLYLSFHRLTGTAVYWPSHP